MDDRDRRLLVSTVNLTASPNDHEALAALRKAHAIARKSNLTLTEALQQGAAVGIDMQRIIALEKEAFERGKRAAEREHSESTPAAAAAPHWRLCLNFCLQNMTHLPAREQQFVVSMKDWRVPTIKQQDWLLAIVNRLKLSGY